MIDWLYIFDISYGSENIFDPLINEASHTYHIDMYTVIAILAVIVIIIAIIFASTMLKKVLYEPFKDKNYFSHNISSRKIKTLVPNLNPEEFKKFVFEQFQKVQNATTNFNYEVLRSILSDKIYDEKVIELQSLKEKNLRNVITSIGLLYIQINNVQIINGNEQVDVVLTIKCHNYISSLNDPDVIVSGSKRDVIQSTYLLTYYKDNLPRTCQKCGGEIENNMCLFCRAIDGTVSVGWVIGKMKLLKERKISK